MTRRTSISAVIALYLMCCLNNIDSASTGYFYRHPIKPFNPPVFSTLRSTGQYDGIQFGAKVGTSPRPRLTVPPIPSLPPIESLLTKTQDTKLQSTLYTRAPTSQATYPRQTLNPTQNQQQFQQKYVQQQPMPHLISTQTPTYTYNPPQQQLSYTPRLSIPQSSPKTTLRLSPPPLSSKQNPPLTKLSVPTRPPLPNTFISPNRSPSERSSPSFNNVNPPHLNPFLPTYPTLPKLTVPSPYPQSNPFLPKNPTNSKLTLPSRPPTSSVITPSRPVPSNPTVPTPSFEVQTKTISNPTQAALAAGQFLESPDVYVIDGRQLKQYKVYEEIDNDIDHKVENFIPENFFLSNYHAKIGDTHPLADDFQQSRLSAPRFLQSRFQQQPQQQGPNSIAIGSGGLGFVKLPNGNIYLGSGSLGYISNVQRSQDVVEARTRTGAPSPDALHFGHGPLTDSLYYQ